jgi:hypothetical protein
MIIFLEKLFGFMDILHINKQKIKLHSKQTYDNNKKKKKNKIKDKYKKKLFNPKKKKKNLLLLWLLENSFFQA